MTAVDLIFVGLAFDIVGAIGLAKGFMRKGAVEAWRESQARFGSNSFVLKSALLQKGEAWAGAALLFIGFLLQIAGNLHGAIAANELGWIRTWREMAIVLAVVAAIGWIALAAARTYGRRRFYRIFVRRV